ncbi:MAG: fasciclin domain-containing protein [Sphingomicrobium sp.]
MRMANKALALGLAPLLLMGCSRTGGEKSAQTRVDASTPAGNETPGNQTISKGLEGIAGDSKFVLAIKTAGLEPALAGAGPYTVLVPDDNAFAKLPPDELNRLLTPAKKASLIRLLTNYILPGTIRSTDITKAIDARGGRARLMTMAGESLTAAKNGDQIVINDEIGNKALITSADTIRSNGIVHHIDTMLFPNK